MKIARGVFSLLVVGAGFALAATAVSATVLYDNLNARNDGEDFISSAGATFSAGPLADSFSTGGSVTSLTDLKVRVSGDPASNGDVGISLLADNSTSPGAFIAALGSITANSLGTDLVYDFSLGSPIPLAPNTRYWIELTTANVSATWPFSFDVNGTGVASEFFANSTGVDSNFDGPYLMRVTAVPEPATLGLVGLSLLALAMLRRKKARSKVVQP
jgi:hypothetical protein